MCQNGCIDVSVQEWLHRIQYIRVPEWLHRNQYISVPECSIEFSTLACQNTSLHYSTVDSKNHSLYCIIAACQNGSFQHSLPYLLLNNAQLSRVCCSLVPRPHPPQAKGRGSGDIRGVFLVAWVDFYIRGHV